MNFSKVAFILLLTLSTNVGNAQTITYLNDYKVPIKDTSKFEPCFFSVETVEGKTTITKIFGMDSLLVKETISIKNEEMEEINRKVLQYNDKEILEYQSEKNFISDYTTIYYFFESGNLKNKEEFKGEDVVYGEYFDEDGNPRPKPIQKSPEPKDGMKGWNQYLSKNLAFPKEARKRGIEGIVYVVFELTPEGKIENIGVMNPEETHELLVNEAMRVVWRYPHLWTPGMEDDEKVRVLMRLPLNFRL